MTEYLNIFVCGKLMVSVPLESEGQRIAAEKISLGPRDGDTFIIIEPEPREVIKL